MAGEWIKVRTNLWNDPRVSQLCDSTQSSEATVVGGLYWLWATADEHTQSGLMPGLSLTAVDRKTGIAGFGAALIAIGWVEETANGIVISRFEEHNGTSAKTRAQTAKRVANHKGNAKVTLAPLPEQQQAVSDALPREEKRREEIEKNKETKTKTPSKSSYDPLPYLLEYGVSEQTATDWMALRKSKRAVVTSTVLSNIAAQAQKAGLTLEAVLSICCTRGWSGFDAEWILKDQRAGPSGYQTANEKAKAWADELTGKTPSNGHDNTIIDIN